MQTNLIRIKRFNFLILPPSFSLSLKHLMKQRVVIKVTSMHDHHFRKRALKLAVRQSGVISVSLIGEGNNEIEVIGEGLDPAKLTISMKKKLAYAELVSVNPVIDDVVADEEVNEQRDEEPRDGHDDNFQLVGVVHNHDDACCNIM